jgi:hypothetical protein
LALTLAAGIDLAPGAPSIVDDSLPPQLSNPIPMTRSAVEPQLQVLRDSVTSLSAHYAKNRRRPAWGGVVTGGALTLASVHALVYYGPREQHLATTIAAYGLGNGVTQLVLGLFELTALQPGETMARRILADPELLGAAGMVYLYEHALQGRRQRMLRATTSLVSGTATALLIVPFAMGDGTFLGPLPAIALGVVSAQSITRGLLALRRPSYQEGVFTRAHGTLAQLEATALVEPLLLPDGRDGLAHGMAVTYRW